VPRRPIRHDPVGAAAVIEGCSASGLSLPSSFLSICANADLKSDAAAAAVGSIKWAATIAPIIAVAAAGLAMRLDMRRLSPGRRSTGRLSAK